MHEPYQTIMASELRAHPAEAFALAEQGPVLVLSGGALKAVLVAPDEWNRIARRLRMFEALVEAQRIEARNEADSSWVSSTELRARLAMPGVNVCMPSVRCSKMPLMVSYAYEIPGSGPSCRR